MDFGGMPPEVNSGRMYSGPGAGPMLAAAAAWDGLAAQLHSAAASYESVISNLTAGWRGPSSSLMAAAAVPYAAWMSATAAQAEQTANQARAAVIAYEAAFLATVPPPVIAANRAQLMGLIATNFLGQNTPAIMATEAHYAEMWAQDAAAMYGYAGSSATAAQVTPFAPPPRSTNPAGTTGQAAAVAQATGGSVATNTESVLPQLMSAVPQSLQTLTAPTAAAAADPPSLLSALDSALTGPLGPVSLFGIGGSPYLLGVENYLVPQNVANVNSARQRLDRDYSKLDLLGIDSGARVVSSPAPTGAGMPTGIGRAGVVGRLSVPQGWAAAAPAIRPVATVIPQTALAGAPAALAADGEGSLFSSMAASGLAGRAMAATGGGSARAMGIGGGAFGRAATTATIIVINADDPQE
ncbi:PPE family protein [Mycobacterium marseillense]|uniref:PPE family protein PPE29 n=1 Tax=Mycobacterium marseillense TaxID=701042 RepID=A0ABN6A1P3_9MYCO|nr:PPE family protein [Mycobacterium marseillense]MCV7406483.1 PPE family protein [Mycobacterium marseillense]ORA93582.1 PPE family protein [Mycobacterium marseillense]BBY13756.1 putative PPE family protein PPE29 [Mycobacterium marseillense]